MRRPAQPTGFPHRAIAFSDGDGVHVQVPLAGSAYRSAAHAVACKPVEIRRLCTMPRRASDKS
jgi:hypothetical protein